MRKKTGLLLCIVLILAQAGCGSSQGASVKPASQPSGVKEALEQGMAEADSGSSDAALPGGSAGSEEQTAASDAGSEEQTAAPDDAPVPEGSAEGIDVDLTTMSSTMVYSEVYNMMAVPEEYIGKTVKMQGMFSYFYDEGADHYYFACIVKDATACCAQGIEFVLAGEHKYPDDYPEVDEEICVVGVFDTYQEGEYTYCTLRNAKWV